jgi:hypothetical protein
MDLFEYREQYGREAVKALAAKCVDEHGKQVGVKYLEHIVNYRKRPSANLAHRLIAASGNVLTLDRLMLPAVELKKKRAEIQKLRAESALRSAREALARAERAGTPEEVRELAREAEGLAERAAAIATAA